MTVWVYRSAWDLVEEVTVHDMDPEDWVSEWGYDFFPDDIYFLADLTMI